MTERIVVVKQPPAPRVVVRTPGPQGPMGPDLSEDITALEAALALEVTDRADADTALSAALAAEVVARGADVDAEAALRAAADTAEAARAVAAEAGIAADLATEVTDRETAIDNEATARAAAVAAETAARTTAVTSEATARANAVTAEATARAAADTTEAAARVAGDALALKKASNLSDVANATTARGNLGLGSAAVHDHTDYDLAGAAAAAQTAAAADATAKVAAEAAARQAAIDGLIDSAPGTLDTLGEIAAQLADDEDAVTALTTTVAVKLAKASNLSDLTNAATARGNLGLGNVDNTADSAKPVSTAQQAALDLKQDAATAATDAELAAEATARAAADTTLQNNITAEATARANADTTNANAITAEATARANADALLAPLASPALTGNPTAPTQAAGNNSTRLATTAYTEAAVTVEATARAAAVTAEATARANADALLQPLDADLTTIAGLDSTTAGALATDGAGWIRKTYAQLKTALALVKADVGLGNVDNTSDANKPVSTAQAAADATKQPIALVANLPAPFVIAHRGSATLFAENTVEAFEGAAAFGVDGIEGGDYQLLLDGTAGCMHDGTIDRMTTATGNVADHSTMSFRNLVIDSVPPGFSTTVMRPPLFTEVLHRLGGKKVLMPESKVAGVGAVLSARIVDRGLQKSCVVTSFILSELTAAVAAGIPAMYNDAAGGTTYTPAQLVTAGVSYLCVDYSNASVTSALITSMHAVGIKVVGYSINRQSDVAAFLAKGGDGYYTDEGLYAPGLANGYKYRLTSDPFKSQTYYHGLLASAAADRGAFTATADWGYAVATSGFRGALQGWACPIKGLPAADTFTIPLSIILDSYLSADTSRWASVFFCASDDRQFTDGVTGTGRNGYHLLVRGNGQMTLYRIDAGVATQLATRTLAIPTPGSTVMTFTIAVSPTAITATRTDVASPNTVTSNDTTYRGGYFHLGVNGAAARFRSVGPIT